MTSSPAFGRAGLKIDKVFIGIREKRGFSRPRLPHENGSSKVEIGLVKFSTGKTPKLVEVLSPTPELFRSVLLMSTDYPTG